MDVKLAVNMKYKIKVKNKKLDSLGERDSAKSHSDKSHSAKSHSVKSRSAKPGAFTHFLLYVWVLACLCIHLSRGQQYLTVH